MNLIINLESLYSDEGLERGGYLRDGEIVECENKHINPLENFSLSMEDLENLCDDEAITATFHTHPNGTKNLSKPDYTFFQNFPHLLHFIVGKNGVSCYRVNDRGTVVVEDTGNGNNS